MAGKKAIVVHSGGMDSSLCLALAIKEFSKENVLSLSFSYGQRHSMELQQAAYICASWDVAHEIIELPYLSALTDSSLTNSSIVITSGEGKKEPPNTLVVGRNGLMVRLAAIYGARYGIDILYMGVMELEEANSGYRDCSRHYMDLKQEILRLDLDKSHFEIRTPLIFLTKFESLLLAEEEGLLDFLLINTISCYNGLPRQGCKSCPACKLRNEALKIFSLKNPTRILPYALT